MTPAGTGLRLFDHVNGLVAEDLTERPGFDPHCLRRAGTGARKNEDRARGDDHQPTMRTHRQARQRRSGARCPLAAPAMMVWFSPGSLVRTICSG